MAFSTSAWAAMVGLQFQHLPVPVGDEAVMAVAGEEGQLGTGRRLHPPNDEPHRGGAGLTLEGSVEPVSEVPAHNDIRSMGECEDSIVLIISYLPQIEARLMTIVVSLNTFETSSVGGLGHVGGAVHPVGDRRPVRLGYGLDQVTQAGVLADGDGEADIHLAADRDQGVGIEATVGPAP